MVGVVPPVFASIYLSSVLPATVSIILNLKPYSPDPPRLASIFTPTAVGSAVDSVTLIVDAPAAMVPTSPSEGTKAEAAPAANVPASAGDWTNDHALLTMLNRFSTVALAN